jgi:hypothetical protein
VRPILATALLLLLPVLVLAQLAPSDFARGAEVRADGGSIFRIVLPDDVYETVTRADFGDIRILNAAGDAVPHTLRRPSQLATTDADWITVPSFPMSAEQAGVAARTHVRVDANGAVLEVTGDTARQQTTSYLVDVSSIDSRLARLSLAWNVAPSVTFFARVSVEGSNDLNAWRTLVPSTAIARLERDSLTLTQNEIELPRLGDRSRYLRVSWPKELAAVALTSVQVRPTAAAARPEIRWRTLSQDHTEPSGAAAYDARALLPVEYVDLEFADAADAVSVRISSRPDTSSEWRWRHSGLFYSLRENDQPLRNSPAWLPQTTDRYWSVERAGSGRWPTDRAPRLKVGWHPHELVFVAQGAAPYTLAYGSARIAAADTPVDALLASLDEADRGYQVRDATLDPPRALGGPEALTPPAPVRRTVLWTVLAAAVAVLAWIAIRTFRDVKAS